MRRFLFLCLSVYALALPVSAAGQKKHVALVVDSNCSGKYTRQLLDGLYDRGLQATFLLPGQQLSREPELLTRIREDRHEIGCRGFSGEDMTLMSRRDIAAEILSFQALLPEKYPLRLFCPPGGCSDGVRQVAEARRLAIVSWCADTDTAPEDIRDGDLILLRDVNRFAVDRALYLADRLLEENVAFVTITELAKLRQVSLRPGSIYSSFPDEAGQTDDRQPQGRVN